MPDSVALVRKSTLLALLSEYVKKTDPIGPSFSAIAAVNLSGHRVVTVNDSGQLIYADPSVPFHAESTIGLINQAVIAGQLASVTLGGRVIEPSWSWTPQKLLFLQPDGQLSQGIPNSGFILPVAFAISETEIFIRIGSPVMR